MKLRFANSSDLEELTKLRNQLWPESINTHRSVLQGYFSGVSSHIDEIIVCESAGTGLTGFAELRVRDYAEGSENLRVPFLEGWFVVHDYRRQGIGKKLISEAEKWALSQGFVELASDTLLDNSDAIAAHQAIGFKEVERTVNFLKTLSKHN